MTPGHQDTLSSIRWRSKAWSADGGRPPTAFDGPAEELGMSVYTHVRPLVILGVLLGLLPLKSTWDREGPQAFSWISLMVFYSAVIHTMYGFGCYYVYGYNLSDVAKRFGAGDDQTLTIVFMVISSVSTLLCIILVYLTASSKSRLYLKLMEIEISVCGDMGFEPQTNDKWLRRMSFLLILYLAVCVIVNLLAPMLLTPGPSADLTSVVILFKGVVGTVCVTFPLLHAAALCFAISSLYTYLNTCIQDVSVGLTGGTESYFNSGKAKKMTDSIAGIKVRVDGRGDHSILADLETFRRHQQRLSEFCDTIAETFSPSFLVICPSFFVLICYNFYITWINIGGPIAGILLPGLTALFNLTSLSILAWAVDYLRSKHDATTESVHSCRTDTAAIDDSTMNALQLFSLQLLHSGPQISVAGFFAVDRTFILAMIGNLATYLVIFVQFRGT